MGTKTVSIKVSREVIAKLKELKHPGQTYDGILRELIDEHLVRIGKR
jgi:predicted DNA-binding protein